MTEDLHSPTTAGPQPTPVAAPAGASSEGSSGTGNPLAGALASLPVEEHPEILVGAAFAGGIVAALILKRMGR